LPVEEFFYKIRFVIVHDGTGIDGGTVIFFCLAPLSFYLLTFLLLLILSGHYRAYLKDFSKDCVWYSLNDSAVKAIRIHQNEYINYFSGATMLLYSKRHSNSYNDSREEDVLIRSELMFVSVIGFIWVALIC